MAAVVAFDLDDTLYKELDFVKSGYKALAQLVAPDGESRAYAYELMLNAYNTKEIPVDALRAEFPDFSVEELVELYRIHYPELTLSEEVKDILNQLHNEDVHLALITDGRSVTQRNKIAALGLESFFGADIFISEEVGADKLQPHSFAELQCLYPGATEFYYVGDNPAKDFYQANRLGWHTVCIKGTTDNVHPQDIAVADEYKPQVTVCSIAELPQLLMKKIKTI